MTKKVIYDILEDLSVGRESEMRIVIKQQEGKIQSYHRGIATGLEQAIRIVLKYAEILDLRTAWRKE